MGKLITNLSEYSDGTEVSYGRIPSGLVEGWEGIVFWFITHDRWDANAHEAAVKPLIDRLVAASYDHGVRWVQTKIDAVVWEEHCQMTLVSFRVRDAG